MAKAQVFVVGRKSAHDPKYSDAWYERSIATAEDTGDLVAALESVAKRYPANVRLEVREQDPEKNWVNIAKLDGFQPFQPDLPTAAPAAGSDD